MLPVFPNRGVALLCLALAIVLSACNMESTTTATAQPPTPDLVIFTPPTPSATNQAPPTAKYSPTPAVTFTPSPTPFTHVIEKGDTMGSIAFKYGVGLQDLLAANPEIDPHFMTIGKTVVIPMESQGATEEVVPSATPVPLGWGIPHCYLTSDQGAWCFLPVKNETSIAVENISAWISLYTPSGDLLASQVALPPLNLLPPGGSMPLAVYFTPPVPENFHVQAGVSKVLPVARGKSRYLEASQENVMVQIQEDGSQAEVRGKILLPRRGATGVLWLAAIAYAGDGRVAGIRKWEMENPPQEVAFELSVFSLGPPIERVELLLEARP